MLLDTHVLLWLVNDDHMLGQQTRQAITRATQVHGSSASVWEIAIKAAKGRLEVSSEFLDQVEAAGITWLSITAKHAWSVRDIVGLPQGDPFDRLLIAQAAHEGLTFVTADRAILEAPLDPIIDLLDARR